MTEKNNGYKIIVADTIEELTTLANEEVEAGYIPVGNMLAEYRGGLFLRYIQTFVHHSALHCSHGG